MTYELSDLSAYAQDLERCYTASDLADLLETLFDELGHAKQYNSGYNSGLTFYTPNGSSYEITIVQRDRAKMTPCDNCQEPTNDILCNTCEELEGN